MLTENDIIDAVCAYLRAAGYKIVSIATTTERGIDIIATRPDGSGRLLIEAKGETSARQGSARFGLPFDSAQVGVHVAEAFRTAVSLHAKHLGDSIGMALPDTLPHRKQVNKIKSVIDSLGIIVYFVQTDRSVKLG
jgi:hypothetical protein